MTILVVGVPETRKINGFTLDKDINFTAADIGGLGSAGGNVTGDLKIEGLTTFKKTGMAAQFGSDADGTTSTSNTIVPNIGDYISLKTAQNTAGSTGIMFHNTGVSTGALYYKNSDANTGAFNLVSDDTTYSFKVGNNFSVSSGGTVQTKGEIQSESTQSFRLIHGNYGTFWRSDGTYLYLMLTNYGDQQGPFSTARPFTVDLTTGKASVDGNTTTATRFKDARTITINGVTKTYDGSSNVSWDFNDLGGVKKSGDTMTGGLTAPTFTATSGITTGTLTASGNISAVGLVSTKVGAGLELKTASNTQNYINATLNNVGSWNIGKTAADSNDIYINSLFHNTQIRLAATGTYINKTLVVAGAISSSGSPVLTETDAESGSGKLMRLGGPRDQQISNAIANVTGGAWVSETPPTTPFQGMRWFNTKIGRTFIYYIDGVGGQWVEENPQSPDWLTTSPVLSGIAHETTMLSNRNLLINGDFSVNQRSIDNTVTAGIWSYVADRWRALSLGGSTNFVSRTHRGENGNDVRGSMRCSTAFTGTGGFSLQQRVESYNVTAFGSDKIAVSCLIHSEFTCNMNVQIILPKGQDDWSDFYRFAEKSGTLPGDTTWRKYVFVFDIPPNNQLSNGFAIDFHWSGNMTAGKMLHVTNIQLELGDVATPFEHRPYGTELALCQRYYLKRRLQLLGAISPQNGAFALFNHHPVPMRTALQTLTWTEHYNSSGGASLASMAAVDTMLSRVVYVNNSGGPAIDIDGTITVDAEL